MDLYFPDPTMQELFFEHRCACSLGAYECDVGHHTPLHHVQHTSQVVEVIAGIISLCRDPAARKILLESGLVDELWSILYRVASRLSLIHI